MKVLTERMQPDGTLHWEVPQGQWQLFVFFQQPVNTRVIGSVGAGPQLVLDHMNGAALAAHLKTLSEAAGPEIGSYYGKTVRAGFCDSLEVEAEDYWTDNFLSEFQKRWGYDLTPWLPFIATPGRGDPYGLYQSAPWFDGPDAVRIRQDYWQTVSDLWIDNFFAPLHDWLHAHEMIARIQAHGAPVDLLKAYALADIPETEQLYADGRMEFLKAASSAALCLIKTLCEFKKFLPRPHVTMSRALSSEAARPRSSAWMLLILGPFERDDILGRHNHKSRTHLSLAKDRPEPRPIQPVEMGRVVAVPQVGGLHDRYERRAA